MKANLTPPLPTPQPVFVLLLNVLKRTRHWIVMVPFQAVATLLKIKLAMPQSYIARIGVHHARVFSRDQGPLLSDWPSEHERLVVFRKPPPEMIAAGLS